MEDLLVLFVFVLHLCALVYCLSKTFDILSKKTTKSGKKVKGSRCFRRNLNCHNVRYMNNLRRAEDRWNP